MPLDAYIRPPFLHLHECISGKKQTQTFCVFLAKNTTPWEVEVCQDTSSWQQTIAKIILWKYCPIATENIFIIFSLKKCSAELTSSNNYFRDLSKIPTNENTGQNRNSRVHSELKYK